ncbi:MAG: Ig-like domain-containing protein [Solirubrobacteraceae bacterium]
MPASRLVRAALVFAAASLLLAGTSSALADDERRTSARALAKDRSASTVAADSSLAVRSILGRSAFSVTGNFTPGGQHGPSDLHLPATSPNTIQRVSKLEMSTPPELRFDPATGDPDPSQPDVVEGQIADLAVYKGFAYLNSWNEPSCKRGGTFVVDIRNPAAPQQVDFLPALEGRYHGEGAHVITLDTPSFQGDVLAVNNEPYTRTGCTDDIFGNGGFDLYDVTNPLDAKTLVQGAGDFGAEGSMEGDWETANSSHSTFMWQGNDRRAYVVFVDNTELHDVDIFETTDPANPRPVGEFDFVEVAANEGIDITGEPALGGDGEIFLHDMVVKKIGDRFIMKADYWNAGYLLFDVTNPADPTYISDTSYDGPDTLTGLDPQEGNAHQGEFSHDNTYILAADEDFSPYRPGTFEITTGPEAGEYESTGVGGGAAASFLPDLEMNGPTVYGGYGCPTSDPIPERATSGLPPLEDGEEAIVVLQRGPSGDPDNPEEACFPGEKAENGINAGYDAVLLVNHHAGEASGVFCGSGAFPASPPIVTVCTTHEALHHIFGEPNDTTVPYPPGHGPPLGALGEYVRADSVFDGWGYTHLYKTKLEPNGQLQEMEHVDAHAIDEALNPQYAFGFGDLSVHEFATDPTENIAYSSYYAGGMRVFSFGEAGLAEVGSYIDTGGNNFWGVEQFTHADERYFAGSDRDYGLYIFRYTGPGAAQRPVCTESIAMVPFQTTATVPLPCSDANGNPLTRAVSGTPVAGTLGGDANSGAVTYQHTGGSLGEVDSFTFTANDGAANSAPATARIVTVPREGGRCFNPFTGTAARESITGSTFGDRIRGGGGRDFIAGLSGDDCLNGQGGQDQLEGDTGDDTLLGGPAEDRLFGGSGRDTLRGGKGPDHLRGSSGNDRLFGNTGRDLLDGGSNRDVLRGGKGRDRLRGGTGRDRLFGGAKGDRLEGGDGRNVLSGGRGKDRIFAVNGKRDTIRCGPGRDRVQADRVDRVAGDCQRVRRLRPRDD